MSAAPGAGRPPSGPALRPFWSARGRQEVWICAAGSTIARRRASRSGRQPPASRFWGRPSSCSAMWSGRSCGALRPAWRRSCSQRANFRRRCHR